MPAEVQEKLSKGTYVKWAIVFAVAIMLSFIPVNDVFTSQIRLFFIITITTILIVAFELVDIIVPSILMLFAYSLTGLAPTEVAFQGFTSPTTFVTVGVLALIAALEESGLLTRVSYWCMARLGGSYKGMIWGMFLVGVVTSAITMGNSAVLVGAFALGIVVAMKLEGTRMAAALGLVVCLGSCSVRCIIYSPTLIIVQVVQSQSVLGADYTLTPAGVFLHNWPLFIPIIFMVWLVSKMYKPERPLDGKDYFIQKSRELGIVTAKEKKTIVILTLIVAWMLLGSKMPIPGDFALILLPWLLYFPGMHIADANTLKKINFSLVFFVPACFGIGSVASALGIGI